MPIYQANLILEILKDENFYKISKAIFIAKVYIFQILTRALPHLSSSRGFQSIHIHHIHIDRIASKS